MRNLQIFVWKYGTQKLALPKVVPSSSSMLKQHWFFKMSHKIPLFYWLVWVVLLARVPLEAQEAIKDKINPILLVHYTELLSNLGERLANGPSVLHARGLASLSHICILCDLYLVKAHLIPFEIPTYVSENIPKLVHLDNGQYTSIMVILDNLSLWKVRQMDK